MSDDQQVSASNASQSVSQESQEESNLPLKPPYQTPKGVHDILPEDHEYYTFIKKVVRHRLRQAGFKRISTPIFDVWRRTE